MLPTLYGDILSDVAAQISGSGGLAGSANIGASGAMFEAIHGSAPRRAGQNLANPSGLFLGAVLMLIHIGQSDIAALAHNAWLKTMEDGIHTYDIYKEGVSRQKVGTKEFAQAVADRVGQKPQTLKAVTYGDSPKTATGAGEAARTPEKKTLVGVDVFLDIPNGDMNAIGESLKKLSGDGLDLVVVSNRGMKVWPDGAKETFCTDQWSARFQAPGGATVTHPQIIALLGRVADAGFDFIKTEGLYDFDGKAGYTLGQGQ